MLSDAQFVRSFVARHDHFRRLEERLCEVPPRGLSQHFLILGQRGMGKTSLLRRLSLAVERNPDLSGKLLPLTFREEQYNVHNLASFWRNCIDALADWLEHDGQEDMALQLDTDAADLRAEGKSGHSTILALFQRYYSQTGRRPVLFIDNIDIIFRAIHADEWALRRELQDPGGVVVIGASSALMEAIIDPEAAFYDFFQIETLDRLTDREVLDCLRQIAVGRGETGSAVGAILENDPVRVQVVAGLAGGNPRTLAILYRILEADISHDVFEDIEYLLDEVTALYKARVDELAPQARVVLDAVALAWNPVSAADVAEQTMLATSTVSTQLDRLERAGTVEKVPLPGTTRQGFQIAERFFNIWYLMRHGPRRRRSQLRWLIEFLRNFYSDGELMTRTRRMLEKAIEGGDTGFSIFFALAEAIGNDAWSKYISTELRRTPKALLDPSALDELPAPTTASDWLEQSLLLFREVQDYERAAAAAQHSLDLAPSFGRAHNLMGLCHARSGQLKLAESKFHIACEIDPLDWRPYRNLGWEVYRRRQDWQRAYAMLEAAIQRNPREAGLWFYRGYIAVELNLIREAEEAYRRSLELEPMGAGSWGNLAGVLARDPNSIDEAIAAIERAQEIEPQNMQRWHFLYDIAVVHAPKRTTDIARRAIQANPKSDGAWRMLALALSEDSASVDEAVEAGRKAVGMRTKASTNWYALGVALKASGGERTTEAEAALRKAIDLGFSYGWSSLFELVADANDDARLEGLVREMLEAEPGPVSFLFELARIAGTVSMRLAKLVIERAVTLKAKTSEDWHERGYYLTYFLERFEEGLSAFERAYELDRNEIAAETNLLVLKSLRRGHNQLEDPAFTRNLERHPEAGQALIRALQHIHVDDVGSAARQFEAALKSAELDFYGTYEGFFDLFLKTGARRGHGQRLLEIFREPSFKDRFWPVAAAFEALVNGEETLRSVNPEVRASALTIYRRLSFVSSPEEAPSKPVKRVRRPVRHAR